MKTIKHGIKTVQKNGSALILLVDAGGLQSLKNWGAVSDDSGENHPYYDGLFIVTMSAYKLAIYLGNLAENQAGIEINSPAGKAWIAAKVAEAIAAIPQEKIKAYAKGFCPAASVATNGNDANAESESAAWLNAPIGLNAGGE